MKKVILIALICGFTFTAFSQKFVIKRVRPDSISFEQKEIIRSVNQQFNVCKDITDRARLSTEMKIDSLQHDNVWNGWLNQLNNTRLLVIDQFRMNDTIWITETDGEYYLDGDNSGLSINETIALTQFRINRFSKRHPGKFINSEDGIRMTEKLNLFISYEKQLAAD